MPDLRIRNSISLFFLTIVLSANLPGQHRNIRISTAHNPNEPSIIIDPNHTNRIVAATNLNNFYASADGGLTWIEGTADSPWGVWGDPVVTIDSDGNFYYLHLSNPITGNWLDRIVIQKSTDGGATWSPGTYTGLNGRKAQDKHWAVVDHTNDHIYITWTQFDKYGSRSVTDSSMIRFSKSVDGGETWSAARRINEVAGNALDNDLTVEGAVPCIGPNGEIYVAWAGPAGIVFDKSTDGGDTWLEHDVSVDSMPGGWVFQIPGIQRCNGMPVTACDISGGPHDGTIYINWSDQRNGADDTDIWLRKSTDGGLTWSTRRRVNDDPPGRQQFFTWMAIDQSNGFLYFVFYDRRNYDNELTDVYMALSRDGGDSFINFKISESPFLPVPGIFFGDYTNISAANNTIRPIWTRLHENELSIWTAIVEPGLISAGNADNAETDKIISLKQNYPNPFNKKTYFSFKLHKSATVTLKIFTTNGREVAVIFRNRAYSPGTFIEYFDAEKYQLASGNYLYAVEIDGQMRSKQMIVIK